MHNLLSFKKPYWAAIFIFAVILMSFPLRAQKVIRILYCSATDARDEMAAMGVDESDAINSELDRLNVAFVQNSQIPVQFVLAGYYRFNYTSAGDIHIDLDLLTGSTELENKRKECGADIVTVLIGSQGFDGADGVAQQPGHLNINRWLWSWYSDPVVEPHEFGHNFNCSEHTAYCGGCDPICKFETLMGWGNECNPPDGTHQIMYFCAPPSTGIIYNIDGTLYPVGDDTHNNRQVIINSLSTLAAYIQPDVGIEYRTFPNKDYFDLVASNSIQISNSSVESGSNIQMRCAGPVTIGESFYVQYGATFTVISGSGALAKKVFPAVSRGDPKQAPSISQNVPSEIACDASAKSGRIDLILNLPKTATASYAIFDIAGRTILKGQLPGLSAGSHSIPVSLNHLASVVIVRLVVDGKAFTKRLFTIH